MDDIKAAMNAENDRVMSGSKGGRSRWEQSVNNRTHTAKFT